VDIKFYYRLGRSFPAERTPKALSTVAPEEHDAHRAAAKLADNLIFSDRGISQPLCLWQIIRVVLQPIMAVTLKRESRMSLDVSADIEERIVAKARQAGVTVDAYLQGLVQENEDFENILDSLEARAPAISREQVREKIERGIAQLERGDVVDGEEFMAGLLTGVDDSERKHHGR
jgi:hypothetical protein